MKLNCADERRDLEDAADAADAARVKGAASAADVRAAAPAAPATAETPVRGLVPEESLRVAAVLAEHGIDAIEVSGDWLAFSQRSARASRSSPRSPRALPGRFPCP